MINFIISVFIPQMDAIELALYPLFDPISSHPANFLPTALFPASSVIIPSLPRNFPLILKNAN